MGDTKQQQNEVAIARLSVDVGYIRKGVDSIEDKVDILNNAKADKSELENVKKTVEIVGKKVDSLTNWKYYFTGAAAAIGAILALVVDWLKNNGR